MAVVALCEVRGHHLYTEPSLLVLPKHCCDHEMATHAAISGDGSVEYLVDGRDQEHKAQYQRLADQSIV